MFDSPSSKNSAHHRYTQCPPTQRHRSGQSKMDAVLAGEGAWTLSPHSSTTTPRYTHAAVSSEWSGAGRTGLTTNEGEALMSANNWIYPSGVQLDGAQGASTDTNMAQHANSIHVMVPEVSHDERYPLTEQDLAARQLTPTALDSLHQSDPMSSNEVHHWVPAPTGHRFDTPHDAQDNRRASRHRRSTRERGTECSSWMFVPATPQDVNRDTQGKRSGTPFSSDASDGTWLDVNQASEASIHRYA